MNDNDTRLQRLQQAQAAVNNILLGKDRQVNLAFCCLLARGHLLIEDLPGLGKTTLANAMARAKAFQAQTFFQPVGPGELELPAIRGVGGSLIYFMDRKSDLARVWDIEFEAQADASAVGGAGLSTVDHIAQTDQVRPAPDPAPLLVDDPRRLQQADQLAVGAVHVAEGDDLLPGADRQYLSPVDRHGAIPAIADTIPLHGKKMRRTHQEINLFHIIRPLFIRWFMIVYPGFR